MSSLDKQTHTHSGRKHKYVTLRGCHMKHNGRAKIQCVERIPYVISIRVSASAKTHRTVTVEELLEERAAGEPHPTASVHAPVCIQQQLLKHLRTHNKPQVNRETHKTTGFTLKQQLPTPQYTSMSLFNHLSHNRDMRADGNSAMDHQSENFLPLAH